MKFENTELHNFFLVQISKNEHYRNSKHLGKTKKMYHTTLNRLFNDFVRYIFFVFQGVHYFDNVHSVHYDPFQTHRDLVSLKESNMTHTLKYASQYKNMLAKFLD